MFKGNKEKQRRGKAKHKMSFTSQVKSVLTMNLTWTPGSTKPNVLSNLKQSEYCSLFVFKKYPVFQGDTPKTNESEKHVTKSHVL